MIRFASRFAAVSVVAVTPFALLGCLIAPSLVRPVIAAPVSPVGAVVMCVGNDPKGTVPYGERTFRPQDRMLSCIIVFSKPAPGVKVRTEWYALAGKNETRFNVHNMVMTEDNAKFSIFTRKAAWPAGKYRVKVFVDDKFDRSITYNIQ